MATSNVSSKIDYLPFDSGAANTLILVFDPTLVQNVSSSGAIMRFPGGVGSAPGAPKLPQDPLWLDNSAVTFNTVLGKEADGRAATEVDAVFTVFFMTSKRYRRGMILQMNTTGQVFEIVGVENSRNQSRKSYLFCKAVE